SLCVLHLFLIFTVPTTPHLYTLSLHDALPISKCCQACSISSPAGARADRRVPPTVPDASPMRILYLMHNYPRFAGDPAGAFVARSEEHTSELQSHLNLVCRLLLEKKKQNKHQI